MSAIEYTYTGTSYCFYMVALAGWWITPTLISNWRTFLAIMERTGPDNAPGPMDQNFTKERHLFTADLFWICWVTKDFFNQYN
jgi:hypothetical protein